MLFWQLAENRNEIFTACFVAFWSAHNYFFFTLCLLLTVPHFYFFIFAVNKKIVYLIVSQVLFYFWWSSFDFFCFFSLLFTLNRYWVYDVTSCSAFFVHLAVNSFKGMIATVFNSTPTVTTDHILYSKFRLIYCPLNCPVLFFMSIKIITHSLRRKIN